MMTWFSLSAISTINVRYGTVRQLSALERGVDAKSAIAFWASTQRCGPKYDCICRLHT